MQTNTPGVRERRRVGVLAQVVLLVVAYYALPVFEPLPTEWVLARFALVVAVFAVAAWLLGREVLSEARVDSTEVRLNRLLLTVVAGVVLFALADLTVARLAAGEFVGLQTKTDALYFTLTTLATVGYGDVHAAGQLARALVSVQMVFNVVVLAAAARVLARGLAARAART